MKKKLEKKLLKYSSLTGVILINNSAIQAQINYYDANPDIILSGLSSVYPFDMNNDSTDDFNFFSGDTVVAGTFSSGPYAGESYLNYVNNAIFGNVGVNNEFIVNSSYNIDVLDLNDPIFNSPNFYNFYTYLLPLGVRMKKISQISSYTNTIFFGVWAGMMDKYLGLRFEIGSNIHYGWVRLDVTADCDSIIIKDYAYNTTPNQGLLAGQTSISVEEEQETDIFIRSYLNSLFISRKENSAKDLMIYALDGKLIFEKQLVSDYEVVSLGEIPKGIYIVKLGNVSKKIII